MPDPTQAPPVHADGLVDVVRHFRRQASDQRRIGGNYGHGTARYWQSVGSASAWDGAADALELAMRKADEASA